jgi:exosortase/archaeosortase family protein
MHTDHISTREIDSPPLIRFALVCALFLIMAVWLEPYLLPLNNVVASLCGELLTLCNYTPLVRGDLITLDRFSVRIVLECTAIHPVLIYVAFVLAQPGTSRRVLVGLSAGCGLLFTANILRIAAVMVTGASNPYYFEICHVYLGQVVMLLLVVFCAMVWMRLGRSGMNPLSFILRALIWSSILFVPWVIINKLYYMRAIDFLVAKVFSAFFSHAGFTIIRPEALYNHTFSLPLFLALVLSGSVPGVRRRMYCALTGSLVIVSWHLLFRTIQVAKDLYGLQEILPLHVTVYLVGQYLVPVVLWHSFWGGRSRPLPAKATSRWRAATMVLTMLLISFAWPSASQAGGLLTLNQIKGALYRMELKRMDIFKQVRITLKYKLQGATSLPRVQADGIGLYGSVIIFSSSFDGTFNNLTIIYSPASPQKGDGALGNLYLAPNGKGVVSEMTVESQQLVIKGNYSEIDVTVEDVRSASEIREESSQDSGEDSKLAKTFAVTRRVRGTLDQYLESGGERTPETLFRLLDHDPSGPVEYLQEPPVVISDGVTPVRLVIFNVSGYRDTPEFAIAGASFRGFSWLDDGGFAIDVVPHPGVMRATVTVAGKTETVEYSLTVSPSLEMFDAGSAGADMAVYVAAVNKYNRSGATGKK